MDRRHTIQIYLVRHAAAEKRGPAWPDDSKRPLTPDGIRQFTKAAMGWARFDSAPEQVLTSPLVRARQTAAIVAARTRPHAAVVELAALSPGVEPGIAAAAIIGSARRRRVAVVGHEPDLGQLAGHLLGTNAEFQFKKGAVCRIDVAANRPPVVAWFLPPAALRALARR